MGTTHPQTMKRVPARSVWVWRRAVRCAPGGGRVGGGEEAGEGEGAGGMSGGGRGKEEREVSGEENGGYRRVKWKGGRGGLL